MRETHSPLTPEATRNMHEYYLKQHFKTPFKRSTEPEKFFKVDTNIETEAKVLISQFLVDKLGLDSLIWVNVHKANDPLTTLYVGQPKYSFTSTDKHVDEDPSTALATIEIGRRVELTEPGMIPNATRHENRIPTIIRVAGVVKDPEELGKDIILAGSWDLENGGCLTSLNISIQDDELPEDFDSRKSIYKNDMGISHNTRFPLLTPIPSDEDNLYRTAGLITQAMTSETRHSHALVLEFDREGNVFGGFGMKLMLRHNELIDFALTGHGYSVKKESDTVTISFEDIYRERQGLNWEIGEIPMVLQKL